VASSIAAASLPDSATRVVTPDGLPTEDTPTTGRNDGFTTAGPATGTSAARGGAAPTAKEFAGMGGDGLGVCACAATAVTCASVGGLSKMSLPGVSWSGGGGLSGCPPPLLRGLPLRDCVFGSGIDGIKPVPKLSAMPKAPVPKAVES